MGLSVQMPPLAGVLCACPGMERLLLCFVIALFGFAF
jgi:hypothetical protein